VAAGDGAAAAWQPAAENNHQPAEIMAMRQINGVPKRNESRQPAMA